MGTDASAAQSGGPEPSHQHPSVHGKRTEGQGLGAQFLGNVVVVGVEGPAGQSQLGGEAVELVVAGVAHQMGPTTAPPGPDVGVDEDRHGDDAGSTGSVSPTGSESPTEPATIPAGSTQG